MDILSITLPSPLDVLMDPFSLCILGVYAFIIIWEAVLPARELPKVKYWKVKGISFFFAFFFVASYLPLFIDPYLAQYQLFDLGSLGIATSSIIGLLIYQIMAYGYHVAMHKYNFLWLTFHQFHHSAERLDSYGSFFHSPMDMIGFTIVGSLSFALLIGLPPQSITVILFVVNFIAFFQHANVKTPRWIGYIIQRPESHSIHHGRGIHKNNYADIPLIDMLFGTFENPASYQKATGFYDGASSRMMEMLTFKDVSSPKQ